MWLFNDANVCYFLIKTNFDLLYFKFVYPHYYVDKSSCIYENLSLSLQVSLYVYR
jgi:hypothetical protein